MNRVEDSQNVAGVVRGVSRREAARQLLGCIASGTLAWVSGSHPIWKHLSNDELMEEFEADPASRNLRFLSPAQFESLGCLSEAIVPGANNAQSAEFIDLLLSVEAPKEQKEFGDSLSAFEIECAKRFGKRLAAISAAELNQLLGDACAELKSDGDGQSIRNAFENLKEWIAGAYYSSEIGMRELGWTQDRVFPEFPGCMNGENHS